MAITLPKVVEIEGTTDSGEFGAASCPHCGADGRYITWFITEDGSRLGAMSGCFKLFPKSKYAQRAAFLLNKERTSRFGLASWDKKVLAAVRDLKNLGVPAVDEIIRQADVAKHNYMVSRFGKH